MNVGGSLNLTCNADGNWSPLPNCVSSSGATSMATATTTMPMNTGSRCPYNSTTFTLAFGFPSNTTGLVLYTDTSTAAGNRQLGS